MNVLLLLMYVCAHHALGCLGVGTLTIPSSITSKFMCILLSAVHSSCLTKFVGFCLQLVFVSVGASRPPKKHDGSLPSSCLPVPDRAKIPQNLLTQEPHFGNLFTLLENLSDIGSEVEHLVSWLCKL